jgi:uncharacterized membrane-anchored protein YitT (DUF2179 family)
MEKLIAHLNCGEQEGGNEIVAAVIVLGFVVGCGAALVAMQKELTTAITTSGTDITTLFTNITKGKSTT